MIGVDFSAKAVDFCNRYHARPGLMFVPGDSEALPFDDASFDVVLNVESSHCYTSMERFLGEVARVLRPGGHFLFTDHRSEDKIGQLRAQLSATGLQVLRDQSITPNVVRALDLDNERKLRLIEQHAPRMIRKRFERFAAVKGSQLYELFRTGALDYRSFVLRKPA
jgi:ubiquinone/menaquinone biosynthesis C-methylase UbiE